MTPATGDPARLSPDAAPRASVAGPGSQGLPRDLVRQAMQRLRVMALLYAAVSFLADLVPPLLSKADRAIMFGAVEYFLPRTISICVALVVAAFVTSPRLSPRAVASIAVVFRIASGRRMEVG